MRLLARCGVCWGIGLTSMAWLSAAAAQEARGPLGHGPNMPESVTQGPAAQSSPAPGAHAQRPEASRALPVSARHYSREALQLTLQGSLVDYHTAKMSLDKSAIDPVQTTDQSTSSTGYGVLGSGLRVGVGFLWGSVLFGVRADLTTTSSSGAGVDSSATQVSVLPRFEYSFGRDRSRPFIAVMAGVLYSYGSSSLTVPGLSIDGHPPISPTLKTGDSSTRGALGGAFGVHAFVSEAVSLDPELTVLYSSGSGTLTSSGQDLSYSDSTSPGYQSSRSQDYSVSGWRVLLSLGLSGWLDTGGQPTRPARYAASLPEGAAVSAEAESKLVAEDIHLPNYRRMYLQVPRDPTAPWVLMRLTDPHNGEELARCENVTIFGSGGPTRLEVRDHGDHYLSGRIPVHGLDVLTNDPGAYLTVCDERWDLGQESREGVQTLLRERSALLGEPQPPEKPVVPPATAPIN